MYRILREHFIFLAVGGILRLLGLGWLESLAAMAAMFVAYMLFRAWVSKQDAKLLKKVEISQELYHERKDAEFRASQRAKKEAAASDSGLGDW